MAMRIPSRWLRGLVALAAAAAALPAWPAADSGGERLAQRCAVPEELTPPVEPIPALVQAVRSAGRPLAIVVLGSLSSHPRQRESAVPGFPARLQAELARRLAERGLAHPLRIETVGRTRALAGDLSGLLRSEVLPRQPALVIWQVGRADARRGNPPSRFARSLGGGLAALRKAGIPTILGDIQFHPQFEALYRTDDYRNYVRWLAGEYDLPMLRRHEMIEHWAGSGRIDLDSTEDREQAIAFDFIQECLAYHAATMILDGAGLAR